MSRALIASPNLLAAGAQLAHHVAYLAPEAQPSQGLLVALGVTRALSWQLALELLQGWAQQQEGARFTCSPAWMAGGAVPGC